MYNTDQNVYKIGVSKDVKKRIKQIQTGNSSEINILKIFKSKYAYKVEGAIHRLWRHKQYKHDDFNYLKGEWFFLTGTDVEDFIPLCEKIEKNISIILVS